MASNINEKYKPTELSKDFKIDIKNINDILLKSGNDKKNHSLTNEVLDRFFNHITIKNQITNINDYLDGKATISIKSKIEKAQDNTTFSNELTNKSNIDKNVTKKINNENSSNNSNVKTLSKEKLSSNRPDSRTHKSVDNRFEHKPDFSSNLKNKNDKKKKSEDKSNSNIFVNTKDIKTEINLQTAEQRSSHRTVGQQTRVVDMHTTSVDLSKYDEKLEQFVGEESKHNIVAGEKQKFRNKGNKKDDKTKEKRALEKIKQKELEKARNKQLEVLIPDEITVSELASRLKVTAGEVVKKLMLLGVMASLNETIDYDTAYLVSEELGAKVKKEIKVTIEEKLFEEAEDSPENLKPRAPIVVVMGHVDHGKTSLLDAIRHTNVTSGEAGGITQHIGAYKVDLNGKPITFLDTPGHAAFTAMRARGAMATDIAILVVAADDGIMPQTIEAINHAKAAGLNIVVAINKIDKPQANPDLVLGELSQHGIIPESWGGDSPCIPVSALTGKGIDELLENVLVVAELMDLKANPNRRAKGIVIESKLDKGRGPVATVLVQKGTLKNGDVIIAGTSVGRVRAMTDYNGKIVKNAGPSDPVEIIGLSEVPNAGDEFNAVEDERMARELAEQRRSKNKEKEFSNNSKVNLDDLFSQINSGIKELNIIVKADVDGSVEAVKSSLIKLSNEEVKINVIHSAVGGITEGDITFAAASNAIVVGFNVRPDKSAIESAERQNVDVRTYRIIYECIDEITAAMKGMLAPKYKEQINGHAEVRQTIHVPSVGTIAGSYILDGKVTRNSSIRVLRDSIVIFEDKISSLKRFKDDVKEVAQGYECGIGLEKFNDIKVGDILESFEMIEIKE